MQAKTIEIIVKILEIIANLFISSKDDKSGGKEHDSTGSVKKK